VACEIENCLCQHTIQPITEAVYGKKPKRAKRPEEYEATTGGSAIWRRITDTEMGALASRFPKARRFASRRKP